MTTTCWPTVEGNAVRIRHARDAIADRRHAALHRFLPSACELAAAGSEGTEILQELDRCGRVERRLRLCGPEGSLAFADLVLGLRAGDRRQTNTSLGYLRRAVTSSHRSSMVVVGQPEDHILRFIRRIASADDGEALHVGASPDESEDFTQLLRLIERRCPDLTDEFREGIDEIHLFDADLRTAITNAALHGAVFIRRPLEPIATVDRFVHEASHVSLNLALEGSQAHHGPAELTIPSPFRSGPRPVAGVLHGVFVFTRASLALHELLDLLPDPQVVECRIRRNMTLVACGLQILHSTVDLTDAATILVDDVQESFAELVTRHGVEGR